MKTNPHIQRLDRLSAISKSAEKYWAEQEKQVELQKWLKKQIRKEVAKQIALIKGETDVV